MYKVNDATSTKDSAEGKDTEMPAFLPSPYDHDTTPESQYLYNRLLREMPASRHLQLLFDLDITTRHLSGEQSKGNEEMSEMERAMRQVAEAFEGLEIFYGLCGSVASSIQGYRRTTNNIDFLADIQPQHVDQLIAALIGNFFIDEQHVRQAVANKTSFNIFRCIAVLTNQNFGFPL